jgi:uncharacterized protein YdiU (UPF0061 family)
MTDVSKLLAEEAAAAEAAAHVETPMVRNRVKAKEPSQVYSLRIPMGRLEELRQRAEQQHVAPTVLMRRWILDRLDEEAEKGSRLEERRAAIKEERGEEGLVVLTHSELMAVMASVLGKLATALTDDVHQTEA